MSLRDQLLWRRRIGTPLMIAVLGAIVGAIALIPWLPDITLLGLGVAGLVFGVASVLQEWVGLRRRFRESELVERNPVFTGPLPVDRDLPDSTSNADDTIVHSWDLNRQIQSGKTWSAHMRAEGYRLPQRLRELAPYILRKTTAGSLPFNGPCVRMLGDLREDGSHIIPFQPAGFFDHLCSNELMKWDIAPDGQSWDVRREYLHDGDRGLYPLASSELANVVGVSTLAVSSDGQVLVVRQSPGTHASRGLLAPSGSGSLEPRDFTGEGGADCDLQTFVLNGANREFLEETGVPQEQISRTLLLGFGRWLERGAKPEFFGLTLLRSTAEETDRARTKLAGDEVIYTQGSFWHPLDSLLDEECELNSRMSVPLVFSLQLLQEAMESNPAVLSSP